MFVARAAAYSMFGAKAIGELPSDRYRRVRIAVTFDHVCTTGESISRSCKENVRASRRWTRHREWFPKGVLHELTAPLVPAHRGDAHSWFPLGPDVACERVGVQPAAWGVSRYRLYEIP